MTISWNLEVDWQNNNTFVDERSRLLRVDTRRGRNTLYTSNGKTPMFTGEGWFSLENYDDRYNPLNTGSPLYGDMRPGRAVRLTASDNGSSWRVFTGYLSDVRPQGTRSQLAIMRIVDGSRFLAKQKCITAAEQTNYLVSAAIQDLLNQSEWPLISSLATFPLTFPITLGQLSVENNGDTIPSFIPQANTTIWDALNEIAEAFLGNIYIAASGSVVYLTRSSSLQLKTGTITSDDFEPDIQQDMPWDYVFNDIRITPTVGAQQVASDSASRAEFGPSTLDILGNYFIQDTTHAQDLATAMLAYLAAVKQGIKITVINASSELKFGHELLDTKAVYSPEVGINGMYDFGFIQHSWTAGGECQTVFGLEPNYNDVANTQAFPLTFPITLGW